MKDNYAQITALFNEALGLMEVLEDKFMYYMRDLSQAKEVILEATEIYYDVMKELNENENYEHHAEFDEKFKTSYAFMTSNYFYSILNLGNEK